MGHLGKYDFLKKTKKIYSMLIFIVSYGHTVKIRQMQFSLRDKYNSYIGFFKMLPWDKKSEIMLGIKCEA